MYQTAFGVFKHEHITFLSLEAAEDYVLAEYPELACSKDAAYDLCENLIWEDVILRCGTCDGKIISSDKDRSNWCFHENAGL